MIQHLSERPLSFSGWSGILGFHSNLWLSLRSSRGAYAASRPAELFSPGISSWTKTRIKKPTPNESKREGAVPSCPAIPIRRSPRDPTGFLSLSQDTKRWNPALGIYPKISGRDCTCCSKLITGTAGNLSVPVPQSPHCVTNTRTLQNHWTTRFLI